MSRLNLVNDEAMKDLLEQPDEAQQEDYEVRLAELIPSYKEDKDNLDIYKKSADDKNTEIKNIFLEHDLSEFIAGDIKATVSTTTKDILLEDEMIATLKDLKQLRKIPATLLKSIIKTREYIDTDALEAALYNGKIDGTKLQGCFDKKETTTLRVNVIKKKKVSVEEAK
jgi:hypothetical protein